MNFGVSFENIDLNLIGYFLHLSICLCSRVSVLLPFALLQFLCSEKDAVSSTTFLDISFPSFASRMFMAFICCIITVLWHGGRPQYHPTIVVMVLKSLEDVSLSRNEGQRSLIHCTVEDFDLYGCNI